MAEVYNVPLRDAKRVPRHQRSSKAMSLIKEFLERNVHEEVKIDKSVNEKVWERGASKVPSKVRIKVEEDEEGYLAYLEE